ncbi:MAG: hypothetical protein OEW86_08240, partial [Nitrosopumilus sp.]|nr:hypothetical protein [Nitrosopumilus sp.]
DIILKYSLFGFLFTMWVLILAGGGIVVTLLGPISISGFGDLDWFIASVIKAIIAIVLVVVWILILSKLKNMIFRKEIKS